MQDRNALFDEVEAAGNRTESASDPEESAESRGRAAAEHPGWGDAGGEGQGDVAAGQGDVAAGQGDAGGEPGGAPAPRSHQRSRCRAPGAGRPRKQARAIAAVVVVALVVAGVVVGSWSWERRDTGDAGATLVDLDVDSMTRDEIQAALDEIVEENMMTISVAPNPVIEADGTVSVRVINDSSNTFDQRFSLIQEQDGQEVVLYESGVIEPGEMVASCEAAGAVAGEAYIEVQAVVDGEDHGNPTRVKVTLVEADE